MVCAYACACECWVLVDAEVYWSQRRVNHSYPHVNKDTLWPLSEWITTKFHYFTSYQTISFITTPLLPPWLSCGISQDVATCRLHCLSFNNTKRFTSPPPSQHHHLSFLSLSNHGHYWNYHILFSTLLMTHNNPSTQKQDYEKNLKMIFF